MKMLDTEKVRVGLRGDGRSRWCIGGDGLGGSLCGHEVTLGSRISTFTRDELAELKWCKECLASYETQTGRTI